MSEVMLPWPEPKRPANNRSEPVQPAPRYEIQRVYEDGSTEPVEILPVTRPPWMATAGRRGFLGAGIASSVAAALLLSGCDDNEDDQPPPSSTSPTPPTTTTDSLPDTDYAPPPYEPPTYNQPPPGGGGGGYICTCNKVCTCIPVCQAHQLLHPDPVIRWMAETVVIAMGPRELPYLRWAAREAPEPLRARINELTDTVHKGRCLTPEDLSGQGSVSYLRSDDPVIALMAAQILALRALLLGTGLNGIVAQRVTKALTVGHNLHLERSPAWR